MLRASTGAEPCGDHQPNAIFPNMIRIPASRQSLASLWWEFSRILVPRRPQIKWIRANLPLVVASAIFKEAVRA